MLLHTTVPFWNVSLCRPTVLYVPVTVFISGLLSFELQGAAGDAWHCTVGTQ